MHSSLTFKKLSTLISALLIALAIGLAGCKSNNSVTPTNGDNASAPATVGPPTAGPTAYPATPVPMTPPTPQG